MDPPQLHSSQENSRLLDNLKATEINNIIGIRALYYPQGSSSVVCAITISFHSVLAWLYKDAWTTHPASSHTAFSQIASSHTAYSYRLPMLLSCDVATSHLTRYFNYHDFCKEIHWLCSTGFSQLAFLNRLFSYGFFHPVLCIRTNVSVAILSTRVCSYESDSIRHSFLGNSQSKEINNIPL